MLLNRKQLLVSIFILFSSNYLSAFEIKNSQNQHIESEFVILKSTPENDVEIWIYDIFIGVTPIKRLQLKPGPHILILKHEFYQDLQTKIDVKINTNNNFNFNLAPNFGNFKKELYIDEKTPNISIDLLPSFTYDTFVVNEQQFEMLKVKGGSFIMGCDKKTIMNAEQTNNRHIWCN